MKFIKIYSFLISSIPLLTFVTLMSSCEKENYDLGSTKVITATEKNLNPGPVISPRTDGDPCNCDALYQTYIVLLSNCISYGEPYCTRADIAFRDYQVCLAKKPTCPNGFSWDGANCYSGVHFPHGYVGFVYGNGFYVQQNCAISTQNHCCPQGFTFDGANCHYLGLYFPLPPHSGFVYNDAFYCDQLASECE